MSEKSAKFVGMNDDMKLRLAYVDIARLKDELAEARKVAKETISPEFLRSELDRQRKEDREFWENRLKAQQEIHANELKEMRAEHKAQIIELKEAYKEQIQTLKKSQGDNNAYVSELMKRIEVLTRSLEASQLSEAEMKALERFRRSKSFKPTAEQRRLLNNRKPKGRDEEKDGFMEDNKDDKNDSNGSAPAASGSTTQATGKPSQKKDGRSTRTDYRKNVPYTSNPIYHYLSEYYTLPSNGTFVLRNGKIDKWFFRVLKRIPEHYEEHFYEVASVYIKGQGKVLTLENNRIIKGCPFDLDLICYILTEHFSYNTPFTRIVEKLKDLGLNMNDKTLGVQVHKVINFMRDQMLETWEAEIKKAHNWMLDETPGIVGVEKNGVKSYLKRYFWGIKANVLKLVHFIYENGSRGLKAIRSFLDNFIGFFTTDGYVVYKVYDDDELHPNQHRSACLTHIRRYFVNCLEESRSIAEWFIDEIGKIFAIEHECKKLGLDADGVRLKRLQETKPIMKRIEKEFEKYAKSEYKRLGTLTTKALKYIKNEWKSMNTILQDGNLEVSNNLAYPNFSFIPTFGRLYSNRLIS